MKKIVGTLKKMLLYGGLSKEQYKKIEPEIDEANRRSIVIPAEILYLVLIGKFQTSYDVYAINWGNSLFFSITGLLLGIYLANMKISGIYNTYKSVRLDEVKALNKELAENRQELQKALAEAEYANRSKTVFLNSMSHDIRTPMNAIIGFTALAELHIENRE